MFNQADLKRDLASFSKRRVYWLRSDTYATLSAAWLPHVPVNDTRLMEEAGSLYALRAEVMNYLYRPWILRFFQWLFTDISAKADLLCFYECTNALARFPSCATEKLSEENIRGLTRFVSPIADSNDMFSVLAAPAAWYIERLSFASSLKPLARRIVNAAQNELQANNSRFGYVPPMPAPTTALLSDVPGFTPALGDIPRPAVPTQTYADPDPGPASSSRVTSVERVNIYTRIGDGVSSATNIAGLTRAFRRACLTVHPDKGGDAEAFKCLMIAYYFAVYLRVHRYDEVDTTGILTHLTEAELEKMNDQMKRLDGKEPSEEIDIRELWSDLADIRARLRQLNTRQDHVMARCQRLHAEAVEFNKLVAAHIAAGGTFPIATRRLSEASDPASGESISITAVAKVAR